MGSGPVFGLRLIGVTLVMVAGVGLRRDGLVHPGKALAVPGPADDGVVRGGRVVRADPDLDADPVDRVRGRGHHGSQLDEISALMRNRGDDRGGGLRAPSAQDCPQGPQHQSDHGDQDLEPADRQNDRHPRHDDRIHLDQLERQGVAIDRVRAPCHLPAGVRRRRRPLLCPVSHGGPLMSTAMGRSAPGVPEVKLILFTGLSTGR